METNYKEIFKEYNERLLTDEQRAEIRKSTKLVLIQLGAKPNFNGFEYLCVAVELAIEKPALMRQVCKKLYPLVAEIFPNSNGESVERDIRHLIENIDLDKGFMTLNRLFDTHVFSADDKPTSAEFIRLLAEFYLLDRWKIEKILR